MLNDDLKEAIEYFSNSSIKFKTIEDIAILLKKVLIVVYHTNSYAESTNYDLDLAGNLKNCLIKAKFVIDTILNRHIDFLKNEENQYSDEALSVLSKDELINIINNLCMRK
jgi:hypothetical protein